MRSILLSLLCAASALAAFPQPEQSVKLDYGQKTVTLTFKADCPVTKARPLCDCTKVDYQGQVLTAQVDTSTFDKPVDKQIEAKTADGKTTLLTMHFDVPAAILLSSPSLVWEKGAAAEPRTLRITLPKGSPVKDIVEAGLNGEGFTFEAKRIKPGKEYAVVVTPLSTEKKLLNRLVITTDSTDPRFARRIVYLQVK